MRILNISRGTTVASAAVVADTFWTRMTGLLNRKSLVPGEGLVIKRCCSIHTAFMRFSIDAIFVDRENGVVGCVADLRPFRVSPVYRRASFVVEVPAGIIEASRTTVGDTLELKD